MNTDTLSSILSKVEEMGLNEGAYLEFSNLMKKHFDNKQNKEICMIKNIGTTVVFCGGLCDITIETIDNIVYREHSNTYKVKINGKEYEYNYCDLRNKLAYLYKLSNPENIKIITDVVTITTDLKTIARNLYQIDNSIKRDDDDHGDDDDDHGDDGTYSLCYVLSEITGISP